MCTGEQASAEKRLRLQPKVMDPDDWRHRLRKVYDILLSLAEKAETAARTPYIISLRQRIEKRLSQRREFEQAFVCLPMPREVGRAETNAPAL